MAPDVGADEMTATDTRAQAAALRRPRALLPERIRRPRHPHWWQEVLFVGICYELYSLVRNAVPSHEHVALDRARDVLSLERWAHVDIEHPLNRLVSHTHALAYLCNYYYATLHFVVTIAVMVWLYRCHPLRYRAARTVLMAATVLALLGFWLYALAPPRMLSGFTDTIVTFHTWGSWGSSGIDSASNQFAAMPSLHIGWSMWCASVLVRVAKRPWVRVLGALYPVATLLVILGTANHFLLDAVGGVVVLAAGFGVQRVLSGRAALAPVPLPLPLQSKNSLS